MVNIEYRVIGIYPSKVSKRLEEAVTNLGSCYKIRTSDDNLVASIDGGYDADIVVISPRKGATIDEFLAIPPTTPTPSRLVGEGRITYCDPRIPKIGLTLLGKLYEIQFKSQEA